MKPTKGENLTNKQKELVLRAYVHRYTGEHKPRWANDLRPDGVEYLPQFETDKDWIKAYAFYFRKDGQLAKSHKFCIPVSWVD